MNLPDSPLGWGTLIALGWLFGNRAIDSAFPPEGHSWRFMARFWVRTKDIPDDQEETPDVDR